MAGRPIQVTVACWVAAVVGVLKVIGIPAAFLRAMADGSGPQPGTVQFVLAGAAVLLSVAQVVYGIQLLRGRWTAYRPLLLVLFVGAMLGLGQTFNGNLAALIPVAVNVVVLVLLFLPVSRAWAAGLATSQFDFPA